jgi:3-hydroxymyristoyl/3-hydroxydecanoyl-(acyl carrier protein) dehydratase
MLDRMARTGRAMTGKADDRHEPVVVGRRPGGRATRHFTAREPAAEGHFPGNPIIPGAVLLREIVAAIVDPVSAPRAPFELLWAKFHRPIRPGNTVEIRWLEAGDEVRFACSILGADRPAVTGALRLPLS